MRSFHLICSLVLMVALALPAQAQEAPAELSVDFTQQRVIGGTSAFSREAYITLHHNFSNISASEITYLLDDLEADLGRTIGRVDWEFQFVKEDPDREGFPLLSDMWARGQQTKRDDRNNAVMRRFADDDIIFTAHAKRIFPNAPYQQQNANANHFIPKNIDGAASYYTRLLDWYFGDGGNPRPRYLEVMNEPLVKAWEMGTTQHELIEFHGVVADSFKQAFPEALVGGYASAYPEYEKDGFGVWNNTMKDFIDTVGDKMDFLSVHLYDFYPLDPNREVVYRSGSNVEAILDLIRQYSYLTLGEVKPFVISEYGATGDGLTDNPYTPERDFHTLRSTTSKLLQLMDRPDQMLKTIPFIIGRTDNVENPYPWAARRKLADGSYEWTHLIKFYQLWAGMNGTYVGVNSSDPDILVQALRDGNTGYIAVHNLLDTAQAVTFDLGDLDGTNVASVTERRLWMPQATPVFNEQTLTAMPEQDTMQPFETRLYRVEFGSTPAFASEVRTTHHYADDLFGPIRRANRAVDFNIGGVPAASDGTYTGVLRVSVARSHGLDPLPSRVVLNGTELEPPTDWSGYDQASRDQFFGTINVSVPEGIIQADNAVELYFPNAGGQVSTVVLQLDEHTNEVSTSTEAPDKSFALTPELYPNPTTGRVTLDWPGQRADARVEVYDVLGRQVLDVPFALGDREVDLSTLSRGTYVVRVTAEGQTTVKKLVRL